MKNLLLDLCDVITLKEFAGKWDTYLLWDKLSFSMSSTLKLIQFQRILKDKSPSQLQVKIDYLLLFFYKLDVL